MPRYSAEVDIDAPPAAVFAVMLDLARYAEWNPWIVRARGEMRAGAVVEVTARMGRRDLDVEHRVLHVEPDRELRWCDLGWFTRVAYGERARVLERRGPGTRYRCELAVTGVGAALVRALYGRALADGLAAETRALKARVEAGAI
jgi:uncharacterized protein YndB with AHSA1/START domain